MQQDRRRGGGISAAQRERGEVLRRPRRAAFRREGAACGVARDAKVAAGGGPRLRRLGEEERVRARRWLAAGAVAAGVLPLFISSLFYVCVFASCVFLFSLFVLLLLFFRGYYSWGYGSICSLSLNGSSVMKLIGHKVSKSWCIHSTSIKKRMSVRPKPLFHSKSKHTCFACQPQSPFFHSSVFGIYILRLVRAEALQVKKFGFLILQG